MNELKLKLGYNIFNKWIFLIHNDIPLGIHPLIKGKRIAIYGLGDEGKRLFEELQKHGSQIEYIIDARADLLFSDIPILFPAWDIPKVDVIIVTVLHQYQETRQVA